MPSDAESPDQMISCRRISAATAIAHGLHEALGILNPPGHIILDDEILLIARQEFATGAGCRHRSRRSK